MPIMGIEEDAPLRMDKRRGLRGLGARPPQAYATTVEEFEAAAEKQEVAMEKQAYEKTGLTASERAARYKILKAKQIADAQAKKAAKGEVTAEVAMEAGAYSWEVQWEDFVRKVKAFFGMQ